MLQGRPEDVTLQGRPKDATFQGRPEDATLQGRPEDVTLQGVTFHAADAPDEIFHAAYAPDRNRISEFRHLPNFQLPHVHARHATSAYIHVYAAMFEHRRVLPCSRASACCHVPGPPP